MPLFTVANKNLFNKNLKNKATLLANKNYYFHGYCKQFNDLVKVYLFCV